MRVSCSANKRRIQESDLRAEYYTLASTLICAATLRANGDNS